MTESTARDTRYRINGLVADYCTSTDPHGPHQWGGAYSEPMHCPGFPARLEAAKAAAAADDAAMQVLSGQGAQCGNCGDEPGDRNCPDCERCRGWYVAALRKAGWAPRAEVLHEALAAVGGLVGQDPAIDNDTVMACHAVLAKLATA